MPGIMTLFLHPTLKAPLLEGTPIWLSFQPTVDLETLEPHIIAITTIARQRRPNLFHTNVRNYQCDLSQ